MEIGNLPEGRLFVELNGAYPWSTVKKISSVWPLLDYTSLGHYAKNFQIQRHTVVVLRLKGEKKNHIFLKSNFRKLVNKIVGD